MGFPSSSYLLQHALSSYQKKWSRISEYLFMTCYCWITRIVWYAKSYFHSRSGEYSLKLHYKACQHTGSLLIDGRLVLYDQLPAASLHSSAQQQLSYVELLLDRSLIFLHQLQNLQNSLSLSLSHVLESALPAQRERVVWVLPRTEEEEEGKMRK